MDTEKWKDAKGANTSSLQTHIVKRFGLGSSNIFSTEALQDNEGKHTTRDQKKHHY